MSSGRAGRGSPSRTRTSACQSAARPRLRPPPRKPPWTARRSDRARARRRAERPAPDAGRGEAIAVRVREALRDLADRSRSTTTARSRTPAVRARRESWSMIDLPHACGPAAARRSSAPPRRATSLQHAGTGKSIACGRRRRRSRSARRPRPRPRPTHRPAVRSGATAVGSCPETRRRARGDNAPAVSGGCARIPPAATSSAHGSLEHAGKIEQRVFVEQCVVFRHGDLQQPQQSARQHGVDAGFEMTPAPRRTRAPAPARRHRARACAAGTAKYSGLERLRRSACRGSPALVRKYRSMRRRSCCSTRQIARNLERVEIGQVRVQPAKLRMPDRALVEQRASDAATAARCRAARAMNAAAAPAAVASAA